MSKAWIIVTEEKQIAALVSTAKGLDSEVTAVVVGASELADAAATAGPDTVKWIEANQDCPAEAYAGQVAALISEHKPAAVVSSSSSAGRVLGGVVAAKLGAAIVPNGLKISVDGGNTVVEREGLDGRVTETLAAQTPVVTFYGGEDVEQNASATAPIEQLAAEGPAEMAIEKTEKAAGADAGITKADRVISIGRGLKKKEDLPIVESLAKAMGAEIGCSMPVADDLGWIPQERYVGRSGQHITPSLYLAVGIQGAPQHLEGVKGTKVIVGINNDPDAMIFKSADYAILGDLYEVVPAIQAALDK